MSCYFLEATAFAKLFVQEKGTDELIRLMEAVEDNRKLISASTPLEVYAAIRRRERAGDISAEDSTAALDILRLEAARMVQEPLNPAALEAARQLLDRTSLRWPAICSRGRRLSSCRPRRSCSKPPKPKASTHSTRIRTRPQRRRKRNKREGIPHPKSQARDPRRSHLSTAALVNVLIRYK